MIDELKADRAALFGEAFADAVVRWPDRPALGYRETSLSYRELDAYSADLALRLRVRGIGPGALVGICLPRELDRTALMLAVWRLGAASLLLDPAWPTLRLEQLLRESSCDIIALRPDAGAQALPADLVIEIARDGWRTPVFPDGVEGVPWPSGRPSDLAYVIYTSGSSGRPKGVEITHGNLAALVAWHREAFAVTHEDRATHLAGLAFDASIWEVWPYLAAGASVQLAPEIARSSGERLRDWLVEVQATIAFAPTLLAEELVALPWPATPLRTLLTGGDRLRSAPPAGLPFVLVNNYGPTECTVVACSGPVAPAIDGPPSIGRAIAGSYIRILDATGRPVSGSEVGEICIGGRNVGRGYRGQPDATRIAFVPDPVSDGSGAGLYRTGDLGSWRADGAIDFHGRADHQLKIRGQRVEPDEIAALLTGHRRVRAAAVVGLDGADGPLLVAYVDPVPGPPPGAEELHAFLVERLPDWAVPSRFVAVDRLPVTANGKLDRAALPLPSPDNLLPGSMHAEADSPAEQRLLAILREVLGEREIGIDDNFFLLGGHSLLGTQVVVRASDAFGVELTLRDLFQAPTVRELARQIERLVEEMVANIDDEALLHAHG